jgi:hypothetical protein
LTLGDFDDHVELHRSGSFAWELSLGVDRRAPAPRLSAGAWAQ